MDWLLPEILNSAIVWTRGTNGHNPTKVVVSDATFSDDLHAKNLRSSLIHSRDIDGQQILQSDLLRVF